MSGGIAGVNRKMDCLFTVLVARKLREKSSKERFSKDSCYRMLKDSWMNHLLEKLGGRYG